MSRAAQVSAGILFVLLATVGLLAQQPGRELTRSTYGTAPFGYKAVHDLLLESGVATGRNLESFAELPAGSTVWWIAPTGLCRRAGDEVDAEGDAWSGHAWLAGGGTAVVFLPALVGPPDCARVLGVDVPPRPRDEHSEAAPAETPPPAPAGIVDGPLSPRPRTLPAAPTAGFAAERPAAAAIDGRPLVLETKIGDGRVVLVGDAGFLSNAKLDQGDAALLVMDLVRAYGAPLLDEVDHGFGAGSDRAYLLRSPAVAMFAGLALLGITFAWWGAALPPRTAGAGPPPAPALDRYVDSLAALYARAPDPAAAAEHYRDLTLAQIRRRLGLAPDTPARAVIERLTRDRRIDPVDAARLRDAPAVASAAELRQLAEALDDIQRKATR